MVSIPKNALTHIQKMEPGTPDAIAVAAPAILPVPTWAAIAVVRAWKELRPFSPFPPCSEKLPNNAFIPARLKGELEGLCKAIVAGEDLRKDEVLEKHADWVDELKEKYTFTAENVEEILKKEIGIVFKKVLEHAGVYKCTEEGRTAFMRFIDSL